MPDRTSHDRLVGCHRTQPARLRPRQRTPRLCSAGRCVSSTRSRLAIQGVGHQPYLAPTTPIVTAPTAINDELRRRDRVSRRSPPDGAREAARQAPRDGVRRAIGEHAPQAPSRRLAASRVSIGEGAAHTQNVRSKRPERAPGRSDGAFQARLGGRSACPRTKPVLTPTNDRGAQVPRARPRVGSRSL